MKNEILSPYSHLDEEPFFIPNWDNKPPQKEPSLKLNDVNVLSYQNISCVIASPGAGKSSSMESIVSSVINKESDNLGFSTTVNSVLYIDFERTETDVWNSFYRTMQRAKVQQGTYIENVKIVSFRNISTAEKRKEKIVSLLESQNYELLLLDGIGDLVNDTNSLSEAIECKNWVRYITSTYNTSIFTTLHPNKGTATPRGHIGSEILREAENVLLIEINKDKSRTITTDFANGKSRNGSHANSSFVWSDEFRMFVGTEFIASKRELKQTPQEKFEHQEFINLVSITNAQKLTATETFEKIKNYLNSIFLDIKTDNVTMKEFLKFLVDNQYLTTSKDEKDKRITYYVQNKVKAEG